jgi:DNA-directed RNA polymerase subunit RPC12/RpoP
MPLIAIALVIVILAFAAYRAQKAYFVCPACGMRFKVGVLGYLLAPHMMGRRLARCSQCGHTEMLPPQWEG